MVVHRWASSHWEEGVLVPCPWICVGLWLFLQVTMWLPRLSRKRPYSFCLGTLVFGMFFLRIHFPCLKKLKPHEKAMCSCYSQSPTWVQLSNHPSPDAWHMSKADDSSVSLNKSQAQPFVSSYSPRPQTLWSREKLFPLSLVWIIDQ